MSNYSSPRSAPIRPLPQEGAILVVVMAEGEEGGEDGEEAGLDGEVLEEGKVDGKGKDGKGKEEGASISQTSSRVKGGEPP